MLPLVERSRNGNFELVLASGSARRIALFTTLGFQFRVVKSNFPEDLDKRQFATPIAYVCATCQGKADAVAQQLLSPPAANTKTVIVACDTVVVLGDTRIVEKPADQAEAFAMLASFRGQSIRVVSAVCIKTHDRQVLFHEETRIHMRAADEVTEDVLRGYLCDPSINCTDLAGGLAIQDAGMVLVRAIDGCYFNVMGFPMPSFYHQLTSFLS